MKVSVTQKEDFHFVGLGPSERELPIDAAEYVGGKGRGLRPPELLFHSIAGCVGIHLHEALRRDGLEVEGIRIETDAERKTDGYPKVFTAIHLEVSVSGAGIAESDVRRGLERTIYEPGTCSIAYMVHQMAPIDFTVRIE